MELKGLNPLRRHVPELNSLSGSARVALYAFGWFLLATIYFVVTDHIPTWSIDSQIIVTALGFLVLSFFFSRKKVYREKYGELAYRNAFTHFVIPGLMLIFAAVAHAGYMNGPFIPRGWWTNVFVALGGLMVLVGVALWLRAVSIFGLDNLTMLYVYYPDESRIVNSNLYGILRHPVYAGVMRIVIGLALLNGNGNSVFLVPFIPLLFFGWIRLVEEKELLKRFGSSYADYRKRVPAFWPKWRDLPKFARFLLIGL